MNPLVIVDTSVWVRYLRGIITTETDNLNYLIEHNQVLMVPVLFQEILQGIKSEKEYQKVSALIESLQQHNEDTKSVAILAANIYRLGTWFHH